MPRPILISPMILPGSDLGAISFSDLTVPTIVAIKPPAKKPYVTANIAMRGSDVERPQKRSTEMVEPRVLIRMIFET